MLLANTNAASLKAQGRTSNQLTVSDVLARVRKAVGYERLKKLKRGFVIEEVGTASADDSKGVRVQMFGASGEYRDDTRPSNDKPLGYDGKFGWQVDRTGLAAPMPQRLREKLLIPAWFRGGWWLSDDAPLIFALLPAETNDKQVALSARLKGGLVGAKVFIDRASWLPLSLVVEYERGPYTVTYKDYRPSLGFQLPQRITVNYRGNDSESKVKSVAEINPSQSKLFATPPLPPDIVFDKSAPAELKVAQGTPFSPSSPGHYYVRPVVDGKDAGWFLLDTGSDAMHIETTLADELKMPVLGRSQTKGADGRVREVTIRQGKTFQLGGVTWKNPLFLAMDLSDRNAPPGEKRAGLIGYPLLARVVLEVTGGGRRIALYDPASYKLKKGKWQELAYIDLTPAALCRMEGNREALFQLDTGAAGTVTFYDKFTKDEKLLEGREVKEETDIGAGGAYTVATGTIEWFEIAGYRFNRPKVGFRISGFSREGGAGVVGREFLSVFTIVFNYPERRLAFIR
jgi:hypothetical protein